MEELNQDELAIIGKLRTLPQAQQKAISVSGESFTEWLKTNVPLVWDKVSGYIDSLWQWFKSAL